MKWNGNSFQRTVWGTGGLLEACGGCQKLLRPVEATGQRPVEAARGQRPVEAARGLWRIQRLPETDYQRLVEAVETTETCLKMLECKMELAGGRPAWSL